LDYTVTGQQITIFAGLGDVLSYPGYFEATSDIWRSTDMGADWSPLTIPVGEGIGRIALTADHGQNLAGQGIIWGAIAKPSDRSPVLAEPSTLNEVILSRNNGNTWEVVIDKDNGVTFNTQPQQLIASVNEFGFQAFYDMSIAVNPDDPGDVVLGGQD